MLGLDLYEQTKVRTMRILLFTSLLSFIFAFWARSPDIAIQFSIPGSGASVTNLNVGHAVVFGPFIVFILVSISCGELSRLTVLYRSLLNESGLSKSQIDFLKHNTIYSSGFIPLFIARSALISKYFVLGVFPWLSQVILVVQFFKFKVPIKASNICTDAISATPSHFLGIHGVAWRPCYEFGDLKGIQDGAVNRMPEILTPIEPMLFVIFIIIQPILMVLVYKRLNEVFFNSN